MSSKPFPTTQKLKGGVAAEEGMKSKPRDTVDKRVCRQIVTRDGSSTSLIRSSIVRQLYDEGVLRLAST